jgi:hypothetical protein
LLLFFNSHREQRNRGFSPLGFLFGGIFDSIFGSSNNRQQQRQQQQQQVNSTPSAQVLFQSNSNSLPVHQLNPQRRPHFSREFPPYSYRFLVYTGVSSAHPAPTSAYRCTRAPAPAPDLSGRAEPLRTACLQPTCIWTASRSAQGGPSGGPSCTSGAATIRAAGAARATATDGIRSACSACSACTAAANGSGTSWSCGGKDGRYA